MVATSVISLSLVIKSGAVMLAATFKRVRVFQDIGQTGKAWG
jgi:hypothetical protein